MYEQELRDATQEFGLEIETTAQDALLRALWRSYGQVMFYKARVSELGKDKMVQGVMSIRRTRKVPGGPDEVIEDVTTAQTVKNVWVVLLQEAEVHHLKVAATVASLNIEDRRVKLAEQQGAVFFEALAMSMALAQLTPDQQAAVLDSLPQSVAAITGEVIE